PMAFSLDCAALRRWSTDARSASVVWLAVRSLLLISIRQLVRADGLGRSRSTLDEKDSAVRHERRSNRSRGRRIFQWRSKALLLDHCCQRDLVSDHWTFDVVRQCCATLGRRYQLYSSRPSRPRDAG